MRSWIGWAFELAHRSSRVRSTPRAAVRSPRARGMHYPLLSRQSFQGSREFNPPYSVSASSRWPRELPETAKHSGDLGEIARHTGAYPLIDAAELRTHATPPGIAFPGPLAQHDVPKHFREIDALVVPSLCFGNSPPMTRETFSAPIPIVATRLGGHVELLAQDGGLLYEPTHRGN